MCVDLQPYDLIPARPAALDFNSSKFPMWRPQQVENIGHVMNTETRTTISNMPVGSGKSLAYVAYAHATGAQAVICTVSNTLLDQLVHDFPGHVARIKGRANYKCSMGHGTCEDGAESGCEHKRTTHCPYHSHYMVARESPIVATNYAYWMSINKYGEGLGKRDLLILDEGHDAPDLICDHVTVNLTYDIARLIEVSGPPRGSRQEFSAWAAWAREVLPKARIQEADEVSRVNAGAGRDSVQRLIKLRKLVTGLAAVVTAQDSGYLWAADGSEGQGDRWWYTLTPVWPTPYVEPILFQNVAQVLIYSATITPQTATLLGLGPAEHTYLDYESTFPHLSMPVYYIPTVALRQGASSDTLATWMTRIDEIIGGRLDRKGIIHTGSYGRATEIFSRSRYRDHMITHESKDTVRAIETFKRSPAPSILVSPVVTTGHDFGGPLAEYQIIAKVPYPPVQSNLMRMRMGRFYPDNSPERVLGDNYQAGLIAASISQAAGRIMRFPQDRGETFIIDSTMGNFMRSYRRYFPRAFMRSYIQRGGVPVAPQPSLYTQHATATASTLGNLKY